MNQEEKMQELADKKVAKTYLKEFEDKIKVGLKSELDEFTSKIKAYKPSLDVKHALGSLDEVKGLKSELNALKSSLKSFDIPKEINITKRTEINFKDKTRKFLLWYFVFSLITIGGLCYLAFSNLYPLYNSMNEEKETSYFEGTKFGVKHALKTLDNGNFKTARKFIVKNTNPDYLK